MIIVGLSGGIACGKSTATALLRDRGVEVIDCDQLAHEVVQKGLWGYKRVLQAFGKDILFEDGTINRKALGEIVFRDAQARRQLNKATHLPVAFALISKLLCAWLRLCMVVVVDMPLLFETGFNRYCYTTIVVTCEADQQVTRICLRDGVSESEAQARIAAQMPHKKRQAAADIVLNNSSSQKALETHVEKALRKICKHSTFWGILTSPYVLGCCGFLLFGLWRRSEGLNIKDTLQSANLR